MFGGLVGVRRLIANLASQSLHTGIGRWHPIVGHVLSRPGTTVDQIAPALATAISQAQVDENINGLGPWEVRPEAMK